MLALVERVGRIIRRMIGAPDYDAYVRHARRCQPHVVIMTPDEFTRDALRRRYERPGSRCC